MKRKQPTASMQYTAPLSSIDTTLAMSEALETGGCSHLGHYCDTVLTGIEFASHCMAVAIGELAHMTLGRGPVRLGSVTLQTVEGERPATADMIITQDGKPGAFHVRAKQKPALNEVGELRYRKAIEKFEHLTPWEQVLAETECPEIKEIEMDKSLHKPWSADTPISRITASALRLETPYLSALPGTPYGISEKHAVNLEDYWPDPCKPCEAKMDFWWPGMALDHKYCSYANPEKLINSAHTNRNSSWVSPALLTQLSEVIRAAGLDNSVKSRLDDFRDMKIPCFNMGSYRTRCEVALGAVRDSGGFFDHQVVRSLKKFGDMYIADEANNMLSQIETTCLKLESLGHNSEDRKFSCNDLDEHAWVENGPDQRSLYIQTQISPVNCCMNMENDKIQVWHGDTPVCTFLLDEGGQIAQACVTAPGQNGLGFMSGLLLAVGTVHCSLEGEVPKVDPEEDYGLSL